MTVGELIAQLQQIDPKTKIVISDNDEDYEDMDRIEQKNLWEHHYRDYGNVVSFYAKDKTRYEPERYTPKLVPVVILLP